MGVQIKDIFKFEEVEINKFTNKIVAFDTFNMLYQFLASIRQYDGTSLKDSKGNVTSHLKGLFTRCVYFKKNNIKAIFVFDGKSPKLKDKEREIRRAKKIEADNKYKKALDAGLMEDARKYARGNNKLEENMILEAKTLVRAFGFPVIEALSEGEAQASYMVRKGGAFACCSQDFDSLLFGSKFLIRNLSISKKRKVAGSSNFKSVPIEFYDLEANLKRLNISNDELIILGILCGTDFNPRGIVGIGPKKALKLVKEYRDKWDELFKNLRWHDQFEFTWVEVYNTFKKMPVFEAEFEFSDMNKKEIVDILNKKDFDSESILKTLDSIKNVKTLDGYF